MLGSKVRLVLALAGVALAGAACGGGSPYRVLPRQVRESVHRDHPHCRGRDIRGEELGEGRYRVVACGLDVVYACPTGPHSRWRSCSPEAGGMLAGGARPIQVVVLTSGGDTASAPAQPAPAPHAEASTSVQPVQSVPAPSTTITETHAAGAPTPTATAADAPYAQPVATVTVDPVEQVIRQWLDSQRATILGCTQTQAALVEVAWTDAGVPTIGLGGEMQGSPGERCVVQQLSNVRFQNVGRAGQLRHVIQ